MAEDWQRLADAIKRRRAELNLTQEAAAHQSGVSVATWRLLESAKQSAYRMLTLAAVERTLGWGLESIDEVLDGGSPTLASDDELRTMAEAIAFQEASERHEQRLLGKERVASVDYNSKIARLSPEDQMVVDALVDRLLRED